MQTESYLSLTGLTATYGQTRAVDRLTLEIPKGELLSLLGPSGCGKSTTLRMIAGFVPPSEGSVVVNGKDITRQPPHRRNIGVVFQSYALFPHLTALDNVGFGLRMRNFPRATCREKAQVALATVGLEAFANRYPSELSGGQQQRVALARALVIEPDLLLLDEPLSNLDANLRGEMRDEIRSLQQRLGITTIFVTHDQQEALAMSDRVAVMEGGLIREIGTPRQLCDTPASAFTASFLGARTVVNGAATGGVFTAPGLTCEGAPEGASALVLRAARLRLAETPTGPLSLGGELKSVAYLGETFETEVITPAGPIRVITPSDLPPPPVGATCSINALPGATTFI
ncbi:ABC transporter ATP-binding protein [Oceanicola sp. 502str15]|uniref:ABC transporter ATP-binding protein n=1 Tax=Oceanicola sp. 502str15 TaxID=2696061 RepID=UPI002094D19F|nr:ABC transporter ATP-binding protein [Oceanicola sp. 502str15]MCO6382677.1 ATP-binding cassette domain-containing protein [Oceanicola sp. 502str15]